MAHLVRSVIAPTQGAISPVPGAEYSEDASIGKACRVRLAIMFRVGRLYHLVWKVISSFVTTKTVFQTG